MMNPLMIFKVALTMLLNCPFCHIFFIFFIFCFVLFFSLQCFSLDSSELVWASISYQRKNHILNVNAAFLFDSFSILSLFAQITVSLNLIRKNLKMLCEKGLLVIIASLSSITHYYYYYLNSSIFDSFIWQLVFSICR